MHNPGSEMASYVTSMGFMMDLLVFCTKSDIMREGKSSCPLGFLQSREVLQSTGSSLEPYLVEIAARVKSILWLLFTLATLVMLFPNQQTILEHTGFLQALKFCTAISHCMPTISCTTKGRHCTD